MRKYLSTPKMSVLAASLRGVREVLYLGWALTALAFCGVVAAALL